jgi:hypothetical protein
VPGFPIRTPWDHSLVDSSPRPIAASHVLHRLLVPRHPPFALGNLTTKMLASTVQFSNNNPETPTQRHHTPDPSGSLMTREFQEPKKPAHTQQGAVLVLSGPNRMLHATTNRTHHTAFHTQEPRAVLTQMGRCPQQLASVSANEHPPATVALVGLLPHFRGEGAP